MLLQTVKLGVSSLRARINAGSKSKSRAIKLGKSQIGASGIEYAVIAGLIIVAFVAAFSTLDLDGFFTNIASELSGVVGEAEAE